MLIWFWLPFKAVNNSQYTVPHMQSKPNTRPYVMYCRFVWTCWVSNPGPAYFPVYLTELFVATLRNRTEFGWLMRPMRYLTSRLLYVCFAESTTKTYKLVPTYVLEPSVPRPSYPNPFTHIKWRPCAAYVPVYFGLIFSCLFSQYTTYIYGSHVFLQEI